MRTMGLRILLLFRGEGRNRAINIYDDNNDLTLGLGTMELNSQPVCTPREPANECHFSEYGFIIWKEGRTRTDG
jgi:hypothetical protein